MSPQEARKLWKEDLARSGLTLEDAAKYNWQLWTPTEVEAKFPFAGKTWAYSIPYPKKYRCGAPLLYRLRVLGNPELPFGGTPDPSKKRPKYWQPSGTPPGVFFPGGIDWSIVLGNTASEIVLVEGEKKSVCGCKKGLQVLGLGGVWSWKSKSLGVSFLPELQAINWSQRPVVIAFDSDARANPDVARAIVALAEQLTNRGARVIVATVPEVEPGKKAGLDDYLMVRTVDAWREYVATCPFGELAQKLWAMSDRYCMIQHPALVLDERTTDDLDRVVTKPMPPQSFKLVAGNIQAVEVTRNARNEEKTAKINVANRWLEWSLRREYHALTYEPGGAKILNHGTRYNAWRGLGVEPKKGSIKPWKELLDHMFKDSPPGHRAWFERWCAWPLKNLGSKMASAVGLWGLPGRGKSLIAEKILSPIYGSNFTSIAQVDLESDFNEWAVNKQLILVDEVSASESRTRADRFKKLVTQTELQVSMKFIPRYAIPDHTNYIMTSNSPRAFYVEDNDRRFFIHRVPDLQLPESFFHNLIDVWIGFHKPPTFGPGPAALLHYFLEELDFGDFDPKAPPPVTQDKLDMIESGRHPAEDWLRSYVDSEQYDMRGKRAVYSLGELCALFRTDGPSGSASMSPNAFGAYVRNVGMLKRVVRDGDKAVRLVAIEQTHQWEKRGGTEWIAELHRGGTFDKKKY